MKHRSPGRLQPGLEAGVGRAGRGEDLSVPAALSGGPEPGLRAPDATGLRQAAVAYPIRWHEMLRHPDHTLLLWATDSDQWSDMSALADGVTALSDGRVRCYLAVPGSVTDVDTSGSTLRDEAGNLSAAYGFGLLTDGRTASYLIRPDGYIGYRTDVVDVHRLLGQLARTMILADSS